MSKHVRHQIFFTILPGKEKEFLGIKEQMIAQSLSLKGLLSSTSAKVLDQENTWGGYHDLGDQGRRPGLPQYLWIPTHRWAVLVFDGGPTGSGVYDGVCG
jgi:hypothetical protein